MGGFEFGFKLRSGRVKKMNGEESGIGDKELFIMFCLAGFWFWLAHKALLAQFSIGLDGVAYRELGWVGLVLLAMLITSCIFRLSSSDSGLSNNADNKD